MYLKKIILLIFVVVSMYPMMDHVNHFRPHVTKVLTNFKNEICEGGNILWKQAKKLIKDSFHELSLEEKIVYLIKKNPKKVLFFQIEDFNKDELGLYFSIKFNIGDPGHDKIKFCQIKDHHKESRIWTLAGLDFIKSPSCVGWEKIFKKINFEDFEDLILDELLDILRKLNEKKSDLKILQEFFKDKVEIWKFILGKRKKELKKE